MSIYTFIQQNLPFYASGTLPVPSFKTYKYIYIYSPLLRLRNTPGPFLRNTNIIIPYPYARYVEIHEFVNNNIK